MPQYTVNIHRNMTYEATVTVNAVNEAEAQHLAHIRVNSGMVVLRKAYDHIDLATMLPEEQPPSV